MHRLFVMGVIVILGVLAVLPAIAQDEGPSLVVADQVSVDGTAVIASVNIPTAGFVVIHADMNGTPGHVVGVQPVPAGPSENVRVMVDFGMATPVLHVMLHTDDNTLGVFEHEKISGADAPLPDANGVVISYPFRGYMLRAYDQQLTMGMVNIAGVVADVPVWVAVHADENGAPGRIIGFTPVQPGTTTPVIVQLTEEIGVGRVWPMLHIDDNQLGAYEFGTVEGADAPISLNGVTATVPITLGDAPVVVNAAGQPLPFVDQVPYLTLSNQVVDGVGGLNAVNFNVDGVFSVGPAVLDVHSDAGGHPGHSIGHTFISEGMNQNLVLGLDPMRNVTLMSMPITPVVWPMMHEDTGEVGTYEYLMIPGLDLPIIVNGLVLSVPVAIGDAGMTGGANGVEGVATLTPEATLEVTAEVTGEATSEATAEATSEATAEATSEATAEATLEVTLEVTVEATAEAGFGG